jgi:hypothetical protein
MRITSLLAVVPPLVVSLTTLVFGSDEDVQRGINLVRFATNTSEAEANCAKLLQDYTNSPETLGRLYLALALNNEYRRPYQTNGIAKIIDASQKALQFPLKVLDECRAYECLTEGLRDKMAMGLTLREETAVRKQILAANLKGLKLVLSKAKTLQKQELPMVPMMNVMFVSDPDHDGMNDPDYKAKVKEHDAQMKAYDEARESNDLVDRYGWIKGGVINLYRGVPYTEEITEEGEKIMPGAPVLKELVEEVRKANAPPPSTPETKPAR